MRRVRTPAGVRHYGQPVGSVIVRDRVDLHTLKQFSHEVIAQDLEPGDHIIESDKVRKVMATRVRGDDIALHTTDVSGSNPRHQRIGKRTIFRKLIPALLGLSALLGGGLAYAHAQTGSDRSPEAPTTISAPQVVTPEKPTLPKIPAPKTAKGYQKMWSKVDPDEWGASDISLSVPLKDGRSVWFYGDTVSNNNGFVNSTAITQDGGRLHVSHGGKQLLPKGKKFADGSKIVYWIEEGKLIKGGEIELTVAPMHIGTKSMWDFRRANEKSRVATVKVDDVGDVTFAGWKGWKKAPPFVNDMKILGPGHYTYSEKAHPEAKLASGRTLWTKAQNWDDTKDFHRKADGTINFEDYRPIFYEGEHKTMQGAMEFKAGVRHVRTPAGVRRFNQPIGSVIIGKGRLKNLTAMDSDYPGWSKYQGGDGNRYYVGLHRRKWYATDEDDNILFEGNNEVEVTSALNSNITTKRGWRGTDGAANVVVRQASKKERDAVLARQKKPVVKVPNKPKKILPNIKQAKTKYAGYERYKGVDGEDYYVYQSPTTGKWFVSYDNDQKVWARGQKYKDDLLENLDYHVHRMALENRLATTRHDSYMRKFNEAIDRDIAVAKNKTKLAPGEKTKHFDAMMRQLEDRMRNERDQAITWAYQQIAQEAAELAAKRIK